MKNIDHKLDKFLIEIDRTKETMNNSKYYFNTLTDARIKALNKIIEKYTKAKLRRILHMDRNDEVNAIKNAKKTLEEHIQKELETINEIKKAAELHQKENEKLQKEHDKIYNERFKPEKQIMANKDKNNRRMKLIK